MCELSEKECDFPYLQTLENLKESRHFLEHTSLPLTTSCKGKEVTVGGQMVKKRNIGCRLTEGSSSSSQADPGNRVHEFR